MENPPNKKDDEKQAAFLDYVLAMERLKAKFAREGDSETASKIEEALIRDRKHPFYQEATHSFASFSETELESRMDETGDETQNQPPAISSNALQETLTSSDDIGQIKQALGRLYKRIDETEVVQKEQREKDRQVLHLWAETNLIQTELLKKQTRLIDQLTQELQKNETFWQKFARSSADLMRDLLDLKGQLLSMPLPVSSDEPKRIEAQVNGEPPVMMPHRMKPREMLELEATLARLWRESEEMPNALRLERLSRIAWSLEEIRQGKQRIQKIEFDVVPLEKKTALRIASIAVIAVVALVTGAGIILMNISGINGTKNAMNGVSTRLTKVEKTVERLKN